ncbi:hypothetical protein CRUP_018074 [Coryphaenoides rupestris]|nr:hypothetical protein CRUP_018074 [Coryphaenoides rupestris]
MGAVEREQITPRPGPCSHGNLWTLGAGGGGGRSQIVGPGPGPQAGALWKPLWRYLLLLLLLPLLLLPILLLQQQTEHQEDWHGCGETVSTDAKTEELCPRFPEPVALKHPIPVLEGGPGNRSKIHKTSLPAMSAIIILNDSVLWNGNFGKRNGSDPSSPPPSEYTMYRRTVTPSPILRTWSLRLAGDAKLS